MDTSSCSPPDARRRTTAPRPEGFVDFLRRSLEAIRVEAPWIFSALCRALEGRLVAISVDDEALVLGFSAWDYVEVSAPEAPSNVTVHLATDAATILRLVDAETTLVEAVLEGRLELRGNTRELVAFDDGLAIYLGGAVRCPAFGGLLHDFRHRRKV